MTSNQHDIELLETYLNGTIAEEDRIQIEQRLAHEESLKADFESLKLISQGARLKKMQEKLLLLKQIENELPAGNKNTQLPGWKKLLMGISILGLLLAISLYIIKNLNKNSSSLALQDEQFYAYILHKIERSSDPDVDAQKSFAYNLFTIKEFEKAKPELTELWNKQNDTLAYFYLAITELSLGNKSRAKFILSSSELEKYPTEDLLKLCE